MVLLKSFIIGVALAALVDSAVLVRDDLIVQTQNGPVRGREDLTEEQRRPFYSFRGIPYAEPPVGNLRFAPPVPTTNWDGVLDATEDGAICVQGSDPVEGSEDCLFVNIYTPTKPSSTCEALPTMVWIYGGGFEGGDSTYELYGPDYILERNVVVVTLNYRLGFLGFLSTGDHVAPGNNGLKDQRLALEWIRDNIRSFCGNPNKVTLAGQSAGSASVAYHIQSPQSSGLFQSAILQSGVSLCLWALSRNVKEITQQVAVELGVDISSSDAILDGLRRLNITHLQTSASSTITAAFLASNPRDGFAVGPVIEPDVPGAFFTRSSYELMSTGQFNKVPCLIGFNSLEGTFNFELAFRLYLVLYDLYPERLLPIDMNIASSQLSAAARELKNHYFSWKPVSLSNVELMRFLSDDQFARAIREFARLLRPYVDVYFYRFSYEGGLWGIQNRTVSGVTHSEELGYEWRTKFPPTSDHDFVVRNQLVTLWTNFIKYNNPTPSMDPVLERIVWSRLDSQLTYLDIGKELVVTQFPEREIMQFWDDFYAKYGRPPYSTY